jgi:hypothetical protein
MFYAVWCVTLVARSERYVLIGFVYPKHRLQSLALFCHGITLFERSTIFNSGLSSSNALTLEGKGCYLMTDNSLSFRAACFIFPLLERLLLHRMYLLA